MLHRYAGYGLSTLLVCTVALAAPATIFAHPGTPSRVAPKIEQIMKDNWECRSLEVTVQPFANDALTRAGRYQSIVVEAESVSRKSITVAPFQLKAFDVTIDLNRLHHQNDIRTAKRKNTILNARIGQDSMNRLLAMRKLPVKNPRVQFGDGTLTLTGQYQALMGHNLEMQARLQVVDGTKSNIIPTSMRVNGMPLPAGPMRAPISGINPLLDLGDIPLSPTLDSITITRSALLLKS